MVSIEASKKCLKKELGNSNRILFTGPLSYYLTNNNQFIDLKLQKEIPANELKIFEKTNPTTNETNRWESPDQEVGILSTSDDVNYTVRNYNSPDYNTCGPTAGAMIINYWYERRAKADLQSSSDVTYGSSLISSLRNWMNTGTAGTSVTNWMAGMNGYIRSKGYGLDSGTVELGNTWNGYVSEITANRPLGVYIGYNGGALTYSYHYVTGIGWYIDDSYYVYKYLRINDAATSGAHTTLINYEAYSEYTLDFIKVIVNNKI